MFGIFSENHHQSIPNHSQSVPKHIPTYPQKHKKNDYDMTKKWLLHWISYGMLCRILCRILHHHDDASSWCISNDASSWCIIMMHHHDAYAAQGRCYAVQGRYYGAQGLYSEVFGLVGARRLGSLWAPVASCGILWHRVGTESYPFKMMQSGNLRFAV